MIYTLTFNASLDYYAKADRVLPGAIHKISEYELYPGGKGINVSQVLKELDIDSTAWSFVAGVTGRTLENMLTERGIRHDFISLKEGMTRINVKLRSFDEDGLCETDFNGAGPVISRDEINQLKSRIAKLTAEDVVIISGSVPGSITQQIFEDILNQINAQGAVFVADVTGEYLRTALRCEPFLVKPNETELEEFLDKRVDTFADAEEGGKQLIKMGAKQVLISMGEKGAVLCTSQGEVLRIAAPDGNVASTIGAGDSMVAGFVAGYVSGMDEKESLRLGICSGSATAFNVGLAKGNDIKRLLDGFDI